MANEETTLRMKGMCVALATGLLVAACSDATDDATAETPAAVDLATPKAVPAVAPGRPAAPRAPAYALIPVDGETEGPATLADGPQGAGGMVTYTTALSPDAAVDFHRGHAEAAGLATVMTMTQGEARAYGAAAQDTSGAGVQVVASPVAAESGPETSVTLTWTAGG